MITKEQAIEILEFFDFFQGQRAGRELWAEKPYEVQEEDIAYFSERVSLLKEYIADVVPKSEVLELENKLRPLEDKLRQYEQICGNIVVKDGVAVGLLNGKETVYISKNIAKVTKELAIRRTRQEVAREIFEEIEEVFRQHTEGGYYLNGAWFPERLDLYTGDAIAELKKKYTEV